MTKTIQNVRTVVVVLMNSCHVSEKLKIGPVRAQITTTATEPTRAGSDPAAVVTSSARTLKRSRRLGSAGTAMLRGGDRGCYRRNAEGAPCIVCVMQPESSGRRQHHESRSIRRMNRALYRFQGSA